MHVFTHLVFHGKIKAVMQFLMEQSHGSFLQLCTPVGGSSVLDELIKKHPDPSPVIPTCLVSSDAPVLGSCHPVIFDCLDGDLIHYTAVLC